MNKYIIPIIKKEKEEEAHRELRLPLYQDPLPEYKYREEAEEELKRGSTIIDFNIDKERYDEL